MFEVHSTCYTNMHACMYACACVHDHPDKGACSVFPYYVSVRSGSYVRPLLCVFGGAEQSSFLVIHNVGYVDIFLQLLGGKNWKCLPKE